MAPTTYSSADIPVPCMESSKRLEVFYVHNGSLIKRTYISFKFNNRQRLLKMYGYCSSVELLLGLQAKLKALIFNLDLKFWNKPLAY